MKQEPKKVCDYAGKLRLRRDLMRGIYQDAFDYCRPNVNEWDATTEGDERQIDIYDDTAIEAVPKFAARFKEALIPDGMNWFNFELPEYIKQQIRDSEGDIAALDIIDKIELDLQRQSDIFFDYIHRSNLNVVADEAFNDLAIGTMGFWINETDDQVMPFRFAAIPLHQMLIGEGEDGTVADVGKEYEEQAQNIVGKWNERGSIHPDLARKAKDKPDGKVKMLEITIKDRVQGIWHYYVIDTDHKHEIFHWEFTTNPAIVLRYRRNTSEVFGRGPCIFKLPTIRVLNTREELLLRSEHRTAGGIFLASDDGVIDPYTTSIIPDTIIPVADVEKSLRELPYQGRIEIVEQRRINQQDEVKRAFFAKEFANPADPVRSATEMSIAYQEMLQDMGGSFGRIKREFLDQFVTRVTDILVRRGSMKEITANREVVNYRYTSALARAQDTKDLEALQSTIALSNQLVGPEVTNQEYNAGRVSRSIGDRLGVDKDMQNTPEEKEQMQKQRQAMMQQAAQG